jgi:phosphatidylserine/phosphatidylglycerophosphate/cardiolipin synthase-like enzyme
MTLSSEARHIRLVTERTVDHFLQQLFLRDLFIRNLCIVSPFINTLEGSRFTLHDLAEKIERECIPTYVVTRPPSEPYQEDAIAILACNEWIEIRFNESVHAKVYISSSIPESESFALFGSGNLTSSSIAGNIEVGMLIVAKGQGRSLVDELYYWANNRLRVLEESRIHQHIRAKGRRP